MTEISPSTRFKYRKLRIAWSVGCGILCMLLIAFWVRSYWWVDLVNLDTPDPMAAQLTSIKGLIGASIYTTGSGYWSWDSLRPEFFDSSRALSHGQFAFLDGNGDRTVIVPHWFLIVLSAAFSTAPWLPSRFSLRTLLIGMTVVAVLLGAVVWAIE